MSQFTVHRNPNRKTRRAVPYLVDIQSDLLSGLATRVVVPLIPAAEMRPPTHLNPRFEIEGKSLVMSTAELAGTPSSDHEPPSSPARLAWQSPASRRLGTALQFRRH